MDLPSRLSSGTIIMVQYKDVAVATVLQCFTEPKTNVAYYRSTICCLLVVLASTISAYIQIWLFSIEYSSQILLVAGIHLFSVRLLVRDKKVHSLPYTLWMDTSRRKHNKH